MCVQREKKKITKVSLIINIHQNYWGAQRESGPQSAEHHTRFCPCKAMGCYVEIPEATETRHALQAAASSQSIPEQLGYLGQGTPLTRDPAALSLPHQLLKPLPEVPSLENHWQ